MENNVRNKQKQLWSDLEFVNILERVKAERLLKGNPVKNLGQLTKEMMKCPSFKPLVEELKNTKLMVGIEIRLDKKNVYQK